MTTKNKWFAGLLFGSIVVIVVVAFIMWYYVEGSSWWLNATFVATCLILAAIFVWLLILVAKVGFAYLAEVDCLVTYVR